MDSAKNPIWACLFLVVLWSPFAAAGSPAELPGVGSGTITPETLSAFTTTIKMIQPPASLPQKWFSSQAEFIGTVATATGSSVTVVEPMVGSEHAGRSIRISGSSAAAGQIRQITSNTSSAIEITPAFNVLPEAGDSIEVFTGDLPPGRWDGACTQADPCMDLNQAYLLAALGSVWLWFDSGDVWDTGDEWCDLTNSPPDRCLDPSDPFRNRILVEEYDDPASENEIRWGVSGTDLTGETLPVIDCDSSLRYPPFAGGLFENQNGSAAPVAMDHPAPWLVVQGMETRCWRRPAPGSFTLPNEWGEGSSIYRREYSGKVLAIHNRHGDLWDGAALVAGNGANFTQGDEYMGGVVLVDIEANTAGYAQMVGQCTATNTPFRSCQGTDFTGDDRGINGADIRPRFITALGGGHVLWIGGDNAHRNKGSGAYAGPGRHFIEAGGFNDHFSNSGVGGTQFVTLVNLHLEGSRTDLTPSDVVLTLPVAGRWGTKYEVRILNSRLSDMPNGAAVAHFSPGSTVDRATDTSLEMEWANVDVERYGSIFAKDPTSFGGTEVDGGFDWTARCLFIDGANPTPNINRIMNIQAGTEPLDTRCKRHFIDVEGWIDGDDIPNQFNLCSTDVVSYASQAMTGTMMQPGNAGDVNEWEIFSQGNSGDWGGEGTDITARANLATSPEVQDAVINACNHAQTYPLGQTLPIGFISTADNLISDITLAGVRNLGFNAPFCTPPSEELYISTMDVNDTGSAVIYYSDPNQSAVSGYNVYRASAPTGPWTLVGANAVDMDETTPGLQFIDLTGGDGHWYYRIAAVNGICEGPW